MEARPLFVFAPELFSIFFSSYIVNYVETVILSDNNDRVYDNDFVEEYISNDIKVIRHKNNYPKIVVRIETIETYASTGIEDYDENYSMMYPFDIVIKKVTLLEDAVINGVEYHSGDVIDNKFVEGYGYKYENEE